MVGLARMQNPQRPEKRAIALRLRVFVRVSRGRSLETGTRKPLIGPNFDEL